MPRREKCYRRVKWNIDELYGTYLWRASHWYFCNVGGRKCIEKDGSAQSLACARRLVRDAILKIRKQIPRPYDPRRVAGSMEIEDVRNRIKWRKDCEARVY